MLKMIKALCSLSTIALVVSSQAIKSTLPPSPCPNVFTYENPPADEKSGAFKWYGVITLYTDITLHALWLNVILDSKADILGNWVGEVTTEDNLNFKIENTKMKLTPDQPTLVRFFIQYNAQDKTPRLQAILFNGREICNVDTVQTFKEPVSASQVVNYDQNNGVSVRTDTTTTTIKSTSIVTTKNAYDRYITKTPYRQTTSKPSYWTQTKAESTQATTEKSQTKFPTTKAWSWLQPKTEKSVESLDLKKKNQTQSTSGNSSLPKSQTWQTKTEKSEQPVSSQKQTVSNAQAIQEDRRQPTSQIWPQTKVVNYQETKPGLATTETYSQVTFGGTSYTKSQTFKVSNSQQIAEVQTDVKQPEQSRFGNLQTSTENVYKAQIWSQSKVENSQQITTELQTPGTRQKEVVQASPVITIPDSDDDIFEVRPVLRPRDEIIKSSDSYTGFEQPPKATYDFTDSRYANEDGTSKVNVPNQSPLDDYLLTTAKPGIPTAQLPVLDDFEIENPTQHKEPIYYEGVIPTLYIPNLRPEYLQSTCGRVTKKPPKFLPYGSSTSEGQWPWQAALYQQKTVDYKYVCGGTLVSHRHVITAAHCVTKRNSRVLVNKNTLTVYLGKFNLRTSVEGVQVKFVNRIIIHPEYNATIFSRDLAILELRESVSFTDWVRPACLWPENEIGLRNIVGKKGSVVGWGFEVTGAPIEELSLLEMPVVDQQTCVNSYIGFYEKFTSAYTYCAGYTDDTIVCNGDSGGGMVFKRDGVWYLRGLASLSVARQNEYRCDPKHYVIFTDIAKFLPWIEEHIDN